MSLGSDIAALGLQVQEGVHGSSPGSLTQDGATVAFSAGLLTRQRRGPGRGNKDLEEIALVVRAASFASAVTPRADAQVTLTGDAVPWNVGSANPIAPGGTTVAWRMELSRPITRDARI